MPRAGLVCPGICVAMSGACRPHCRPAPRRSPRRDPRRLHPAHDRPACHRRRRARHIHGPSSQRLAFARSSTDLGRLRRTLNGRECRFRSRAGAKLVGPETTAMDELRQSSPGPGSLSHPMHWRRLSCYSSLVGPVDSSVRAICGRAARSAPSAWLAALLVDDFYAVGGVHHRLVLLIPVHLVVLMPGLAKDLNDLTPTSGLTVDAASLKPVTDTRRARCVLRAHVSD
jgi:hypothetical protein